MRELHLFAGAGGGILGGILLGHTCVCAVEIEPYRRQDLLSRQRDGFLPKFPIWDDIRTFEGRPWKGIVDIVAGGFPCQDISSAGKGEGIEGSRSGLWSEMARVIGEVQPSFAFVENSPMLTLRGIDRVLGDLAEMGFNARWGVLSAADAIWLGGTPCLDHLRERIWIVAENANCHSPRRAWQGPSQSSGRINKAEFIRAMSQAQQGRENQRASGEQDAECPSERCRPGRTRRPNTSDSRKREQAFQTDTDSRQRIEIGRSLRAGRRGTCESEINGAGENRTHWWESEPRVGRVVHGIPNRVDRLAAVGDAQVPAVVKLAWETLNR